MKARGGIQTSIGCTALEGRGREIMQCHCTSLHCSVGGMGEDDSG